MFKRWYSVACSAGMCALALLLAGHLSAQDTSATPYSQELFHPLKWRNIGPLRGGRSLAVAGSAAGVLEYYFGAAGGGYISADPSNSDIFYAGAYGGYITSFDRKTNQRRYINVWPEYPVGQSAKDLKERFQWTTPIVLSPLDPKGLYVSSQHLWRTTNAGQTWTQISPDLTRHDPSKLGPSGRPLTLDQTGVEPYGTIFTVAPSH